MPKRKGSARRRAHWRCIQATGAGLYLSRDAGQRFQLVVRGEQVLSAAFSLDGSSL